MHQKKNSWLILLRYSLYCSCLEMNSQYVWGMSACIYLESLRVWPFAPWISPSCLSGLQRKSSGYSCHSTAASPLVLVSATYMACKLPEPPASLSHTLPASCHLKAIMNQVLNQMFSNTISVPQDHRGRYLFIPILQMSKLRLRESDYLAGAGKTQIWTPVC